MQFPSIPVAVANQIPHRLTTKTDERKMQKPAQIQKAMPYLNIAVRIQKLRKADVFGPTGRSIAENLSPADGVARNGSDAKIHQGDIQTTEQRCKLLADLLPFHNSK